MLRVKIGGGEVEEVQEVSYVGLSLLTRCKRFRWWLVKGELWPRVAKGMVKTVRIPCGQGLGP